MGIVDATGVLYDPEGLNKEGLLYLCENKYDIDHYNLPLSAQGYKVLLDDQNVVLPDGSHYNNGVKIRNEYYR